MADKDLIEIIARITAKTVTDVSEIYYREHPDSTRPKEDTAAEDAFGGIPFGTPFSEAAGCTGGAVPPAKRIIKHNNQ